jgi:hypothetical protein
MKTISIRRKGHNFWWTNFKQRRKEKICWLYFKSRFTSMEILRKVITPKLLVEITTFVRRYLKMKMKMTMILKDSQTN